MNYQQIQQYLKEKILTIEIKNSKEEIKELQAEWLTAQGLTASEELLNSVISFYQSLVATINEENNYHLLPKYEELTADYFDTNKPKLGRSDALENDINPEHYKLLDKIIADYQQEKDKNDTLVAKLQKQFESIKIQVNQLFKNKTEGDDLDVNLAGEMIKLLGVELQKSSAEQTKPDFMELLVAKKTEDCQPLFKILLTYRESPPIVSYIKQWLVNYQQLTQPEQKLLTEEHKSIKQFDQIITSCQPKKKQQDDHKNDDAKETSETVAKADQEKNRQDLMYFGGFILILAIAASFFKSKD